MWRQSLFKFFRAFSETLLYTPVLTVTIHSSGVDSSSRVWDLGALLPTLLALLSSWRPALRCLEKPVQPTSGHQKVLDKHRKKCFRGNACQLKLWQALPGQQATGGQQFTTRILQAHSQVETWLGLSPESCKPANRTSLKSKHMVTANLKGRSFSSHQRDHRFCLEKPCVQFLSQNPFTIMWPEGKWWRYAELQTSLWTRESICGRHAWSVSHFGLHCTHSKPF